MHEPPEQRNSLGRQAGMEAAEQHNGRKTHAHTHIKEKSNFDNNTNDDKSEKHSSAKLQDEKSILWRINLSQPE